MPTFRTPRALLLVAAATLGAALACTLGQGGPNPTAAPLNTQAVATAGPDDATPAPDEPTQAAAGTPEIVIMDDPLEIELAVGPGDFFLDDPAIGLAELSSYQANLIVSFTGTQAGEPLTWSETYALIVAARDPAQRQLTVTRTGRAAPNQFLAEMGDLAYERRGDAACTVALLDPLDRPIDVLEPAAFLDAVLGADAAGDETVGDLATSRYTFDQRALGLTDLVTANGTLWVAADGGYVVKYYLNTEGGADYFGAETEGALTIDYTLTGPNAPAAPAPPLPADCPPGRVPVPPLADATNVADLPGTLTFDTPTSLPDVSTYYQSDLPARGWAASAPPALLPPDPALPTTGSVQDFTQGDLQLTVLLTTDAAGTHVRLVMLRPVPLTGPTP